MNVPFHPSGGRPQKDGRKARSRPDALRPAPRGRPSTAPDRSPGTRPGRLRRAPRTDLDAELDRSRRAPAGSPPPLRRLQPPGRAAGHGRRSVHTSRCSSMPLALSTVRRRNKLIARSAAGIARVITTTQNAPRLSRRAVLSHASPPIMPVEIDIFGRDRRRHRLSRPKMSISTRAAPGRSQRLAEPTEPRRSQASTTRAAMPFSAALPHERGS